MKTSSPPSEQAQIRFAESYRRRVAEVLECLDLEAIGQAVEVLYDAWRRNALVAIAGNGGSAATASHMANDLVKAARVPEGAVFRSVSLADNVSALTAHANDHGYETVFAAQMDSLFQANDVLVAISASGNSPNVLAAAERARALGGRTIALVGFGGGDLARHADVVLHAHTEAGEYGPVEDIHMILNHMITGCLLERMHADSANGS